MRASGQRPDANGFCDLCYSHRTFLKTTLPSHKGRESIRGTTLVGCFHAAHSTQRLMKWSDWRRMVTLRCAARTTGSLWSVPPGGSGGNFGDHSLSGGLSLCPTLPCQVQIAYFPPSMPLAIRITPIISKTTTLSRYAFTYDRKGHRFPNKIIALISDRGGSDELPLTSKSLYSSPF